MLLKIQPVLLNLLEPNTITAFMLVGTRVTGLFTSAPGLDAQGVPVMIKLWLALGLTLILVVAVFHWPDKTMPNLGITTLPTLIVWAAWEFGLGWLLGTACKWSVDTIRLSGELISTQMGLSMANILDPGSGVMNSLLAQGLAMLASLLFFHLNLHHILLAGLAKSFLWLPLAHWPANGAWLGSASQHIVHWFSEAFSLGLMLGAPVLALLLLSELALAFVSKLMPQMNIFMVAMPLKIAVGAIGLSLGLPTIMQRLEEHWLTNFNQIFEVFKGLV